MRVKRNFRAHTTDILLLLLCSTQYNLTYISLIPTGASVVHGKTVSDLSANTGLYPRVRVSEEKGDDTNEKENTSILV